jgi:hypothetical protein
MGTNRRQQGENSERMSEPSEHTASIGDPCMDVKSHLIAGLALLTGMTKSSSLWWIELMILPSGILSTPLTRFTMRRWPQKATDEVKISALPLAASPQGL